MYISLLHECTAEPGGQFGRLTRKPDPNASLSQGEHVVVGVSRPDFDPSTGDLPSGASGGGWGYYANGGQLSHGGR